MEPIAVESFLKQHPESMVEDTSEDGGSSMDIEYLSIPVGMDVDEFPKGLGFGFLKLGCVNQFSLTIT